MSDSIIDSRLDDRKDHDDLTLNQEYLIAGFVILLFGLLYWFLNHGWNASSDLDLVAGSPFPSSQLESRPAELDTGNAGLKAATVGASAGVGAAALAAKTTPQADTAQANTLVAGTTDPTTATQEEIAPPLTLTTQEIAELKAAEVALTQSNAVREQAADETKDQAATISKLENKGENTDRAKDNTTNKKAVDTNPVDKNTSDDPVASADKDNKATDNTSQAQTYTLPDGTKIDIEPKGFEGDLKTAITNRELFKPIIFDSIYFESGSTTIKSESDHQLKATAALLHHHQDTQILLRGHTDSTGGVSRNVQLSLYRANATALALGKLGINTQRIRIIGVGAAEPIASNDTKEGRSKNRRIEVLITK